MNTFLGDNPQAYTGLGVLGASEDSGIAAKIGGVKSSGFQGGFINGGLGIALIGENGTERFIPATQTESASDMLERYSKVITDAQLVATPKLGVYRPNLEDRKIGKVGMHMVIDGFPRALREVAKVMTWAAVAKGYKLHDWRNLPDAHEAFPAAEYRHQNDSCIQKAEGVPAIERTDEESKLLHAAHKVFNGLAELELILAGVIK